MGIAIIFAHGALYFGWWHNDLKEKVMNRKQIAYALSVILVWTIPFGFAGWLFEAGLKWAMIGLLIGLFFVLLGKLAGNWVGRSLTLVLLIGAIIGIATVWIIFGSAYVVFTMNFEPALGSPPPDQNGPAMPNVFGMLEWLFYTGAMVLGSVAGAVVGGVLGFGGGLIGSLIMRLWRGRTRKVEVHSSAC